MGYLDKVLIPKHLGEKAEALYEAIIKANVPVDAIAVRGTSGTIMGGVLSLRLNVPIIVIRKDDEFAHGLSIENPIHGQPIVKYIIIDDGISTGSTIAAIIRGIKEIKDQYICTGIFLYNQELFGSLINWDRVGQLISITECLKFYDINQPQGLIKTLFSIGEIR